MGKWETDSCSPNTLCPSFVVDWPVGVYHCGITIDLDPLVLGLGAAAYSGNLRDLLGSVGGSGCLKFLKIILILAFFFLTNA